MVSSNIVRYVIGALLIVGAAGTAWWSFHYSQAKRHWQRAELALAENNPEEAREQLSVCLRWWDDRVDVHLLAAKTARLAEHIDEAEEHLSWCESFDREGLLAGEIRKERALLQAYQGDLTGNAEIIAPSGPNDPYLSAEALATMAHGFEQTFDRHRAGICLSWLFQNHPDDWRRHLLGAELYVEMKLYEEAVKEFELAVLRHPRALKPRLGLGKAQLELGNVRDAAVTLEILGALYPDDPEVLLAQAKLATYRGNRDDARRQLERSLEKNPKHVEALLARGRLDFRDGQAQQAIPWFERAVDTNPGTIEGWQGLAYCYEAVERPDQAAKCRAEATRLATEEGAMMRLQKSLPEEADRKVAQLEDLAERYDRLGRPALANRWRFRILRMEPKHAATHQAMADYFQRNGQSHLAARHRAMIQK